VILPLDALLDRLRSIRWRFALTTVAVGVVGVAVREAMLHLVGSVAPWRELGLWGPPTLVGGAMFWMAHRLGQRIETLRRRVESVAASEVDAAATAPTACELGRLAHSVDRLSSRIHDKARHVHAMAFVDPATQLPNRGWIDGLVAHPPVGTGNGGMAVLRIGLDGLDRIHDTLGHRATDELLRLASRRIQAQGIYRGLWPDEHSVGEIGNPCDHPFDLALLGRYACVEFVALLPGATDREALAALGGRIVAAVGEPFTVNDQSLCIGATVGIALAPADTRDLPELMEFADQAMRAGQRIGERCRFFARQTREALITLARTEAELAQALLRHELVLYYQPEVAMASQRLVGVEALARWRHPTRGLLAPQEFIDVAERAGLMPALGRQVLRLAVAQCRAWSDEGLPLAVAVNVSPSQFGDPGFVGQVLGALREADVPADRLTIEITESMAMTDFDATSERLAQLRAAGVKIALDDFGTGYSNLAQLSRLPLDVLKIDRSLVLGIGQDGKSNAIVSAIVGMARALGCRTIAEGIETELQQSGLQGLQCDIGQGHLYGGAMPPRALVDWHFRWAHDVSLRQRRRAAAQAD